MQTHYTINLLQHTKSIQNSEKEKKKKKEINMETTLICNHKDHEETLQKKNTTNHSHQTQITRAEPQMHWCSKTMK